MNFLEYFLHLFIHTLVLLSLSSAFVLHQHIFLNLEHQVDAVRTSIAFYHLLQSWKMIEIEQQHLKIKKTAILKQHVDRIHSRKSLSFLECEEWMTGMPVLVWNANSSFITYILNCAPGKIILEGSIPKTLQVPFDWLVFYPIELWVKDKKMYLKYHNNTQVWFSGFEYLKWTIKEKLEVEIKWPNLPVIKWSIG